MEKNFTRFTISPETPNDFEKGQGSPYKSSLSVIEELQKKPENTTHPESSQNKESDYNQILSENFMLK